MIGLQGSMIILVVVYMFVTFLLASVILDRVTAEKRQVGKRINFIVDRKSEKELAAKKKGKDNKESSDYKRKESIVSKLGVAISEELHKSNILMKPEEFAMMWIALTFIPALLVLLFIHNQVLPILLAVAGAFGPIVFVKSKQGKKVKEFETQLSDALLIAANCLRSGLTFSQAMGTIADEMEDPISSEFKRVVNEISYGSSQDEALEALAERINSSDLTMVVSAVSVQRQTGGNLSEILDIIGNTIRERAKIRGEIKTLTAQGRASGTLIGVLPIVLGLLLFVINPSYIMMLFQTDIGLILIAVRVFLEVLGFTIINKIVTIKF